MPTKNAIVRYAIYPAIGIARVGNSPEHFIGPEAPGEVPKPAGG
ncbi:MAG TPA: LodA/GoxA family CTQ-dependent oxidase, partial [Blastocatellia bacterium]|nr:LodA/GoxA family CTQ-dependent oxidase [Blastocatellia bacterium]